MFATYIKDDVYMEISFVHGEHRMVLSYVWRMLTISTGSLSMLDKTLDSFEKMIRHAKALLAPRDI